MINTCMASGLPVAVGAADGTELDLVVPGETGWRLEPQSGAWAEWIQLCSGDGDRLRSLGQGARSLIRERASIGNMAYRLVEACRSATGREST
jgi:glycosyltransferase involved in cell wall biosynthesis